LLLFFGLGFGRGLLFFEPLLFGFFRGLLFFELLLLLDLVGVLLDFDFLRLDLLFFDLGVDVRLALAPIDGLRTIDRFILRPFVRVTARVGRLGADVEADTEVDDLGRDVVRRNQEANLGLDGEVPRDALIEADAGADERRRAERRSAGFLVDRRLRDERIAAFVGVVGETGVAVPTRRGVLGILQTARGLHVRAAGVEQNRRRRADVDAHQQRQLQEERLRRTGRERIVVGGQANELHARHHGHVEITSAEEVDLGVEVERAAGGEAQADVDPLGRAHADAHGGHQRRGDGLAALACLDQVPVVVGRGVAVFVHRVDELFRAVRLHVQTDVRLDLPRGERSRRAVRLRVDTTRQRKGENEPEHLRRSIHVAGA
jgi:hypothetical protein